MINDHKFEFSHEIKQYYRNFHNFNEILRLIFDQFRLISTFEFLWPKIIYLITTMVVYMNLSLKNVFCQKIIA